MSACDKTTLNDVLRAQKPNIVLILADDLGIGDVGAYRKEPIQTLQIDKLARNGGRLTPPKGGWPRKLSSEKITLLYDLKADPSEQNNLADAPPEIVKRLKTEYEILAWSLSKPMIPAIRSTPAEFNGTTVKLIF